MRAYECSLTSEGKAALFELLVATEQPIRIKRRRGREEWRAGGWIRYDWCVFWKEPTSEIWKATFGGNFRTPEVLEPLFNNIVTACPGCSWIWPERKSEA